MATIELGSPPDGFNVQVKEGVESILNAGDKGGWFKSTPLESVTGSSEKPVEVSRPLRIKALDLESAERGVLNAAEDRGWLYLLFVDEDAVGTADVLKDGAGSNESSFRGITYGAFAKGILVAIQAAEKKKGTYTACILNVPSVQFWSVWLRRKDKAGDVIFHVTFEGQVVEVEISNFGDLIKDLKERTSKTGDLISFEDEEPPEP